jgi:type III secretion protein O
MKTPVDEIFRIKKFREERAERDLAKAEEKLREAEKTLEEKKQALEEYKIWRVQEEERKYKELMAKKSVKRGALDDLKQEVKFIRDKEIDFAQAVSDAASAVDSAKHDVENAKKAYIQAVRNTEKMAEMQHSLETELTADATLKEEKEVEDSFKYKTRPPL